MRPNERAAIEDAQETADEALERVEELEERMERLVGHADPEPARGSYPRPDTPTGDGEDDQGGRRGVER